ncbi:RAB6A-GEF complex partner protein 2-like isoform X3 [Lethenteron reissneri]|uniref:RAB6A-GEF complex partner protein 2-like isoform X3 n=1 Tax=Lethenteron reissneri TaxID=7753 RepID=UPI002AB7E726|nr:RAB6A-GEF complex partner protein 2-like isoform X3 [Lethenteron reissneri]
MIEMVAELTRGPVFLAGEVLECVVTFTNPEVWLPSSAGRESGSETLAWASVQLHCQMLVSEVHVALPPSSPRIPGSQAMSETAFVPNRGERGQCVLSTPPKILFCDLRLAPGESKAFVYRETLPADAPPSLNGQAVRYAYRLSVGCQRLQGTHATALLRVPFRVLVLQGLLDYRPLDEDDGTVAPVNPFLDDGDGDDDDDGDDGKDKEWDSDKQGGSKLIDVAMDLIAEVISRSRPCALNVVSPQGGVGRLSVARTAYRLGEEVSCSIDFSAGEVRCLHFSVLLQAQERVEASTCQQRHRSPSPVTHASHHELCLHTGRTHAALPVPLHAPPSFSSPLVSVRWRLHFQFVVAVEPEVVPPLQRGSAPGLGCVWRGAQSVRAETLSWDLPITVLPCDPLTARSGWLVEPCGSMLLVSVP